MLFLYIFSEILLPFVAGMVLAYFLDPVADRLERLGLSRIMATILILIGFIIVLVAGAGRPDPGAGLAACAISSASCRNISSRLQALITSFDPQWLEQQLRRQRRRACATG